MAYINKPDPLPWAPKPAKPAQAGRAVDNQKFYNSTRWRKFAKYDKSINPFCVECVLWELTKLINDNKTKTGKRFLLDLHRKVALQRRDLEEIIKGFYEAPRVLAASLALSKNPISDHIKRIEAGGDPMDPENVQTLCSRHHNIKSGKESHKPKK